LSSNYIKKSIKITEDQEQFLQSNQQYNLSGICRKAIDELKRLGGQPAKVSPQPNYEPNEVDST